jgi:hypothetical protein
VVRVTVRARPAEPGERCTCGRFAQVVYATSWHGEVGWCGVHDGGDRRGPCPFCDGRRHTESRCPRYRLRLEEEVVPNESA